MKVLELGHVVLYVRNLDISKKFYADILGWKQIGSIGDIATLHSSGRTHHELLLIEVGQNAKSIPSGTRVGMYHFGIKIGESDQELIQAMGILKKSNVRILGSSDHIVTHSIYISDPDGNEIEIYIDVQPETWRNQPELIASEPKPLNIFDEN